MSHKQLIKVYANALSTIWLQLGLTNKNRGYMTYREVDIVLKIAANKISDKIYHISLLEDAAAFLGALDNDKLITLKME